MTQYLYAKRNADSFQHLLDSPTGPALCKERAAHWHFGYIASHCFPGVPLCEACKLERDARKSDARAAELRAQAAAIKTFWVQETP